jgi:glycosyltransferase involved in cell wall biosynthesis
MYRGDKDLRLGIELCEKYGFRYTMIVPDVSSPNDRRIFKTARFPMEQARKYHWPEGFQIQLVPAQVINLSVVSPSKVFSMVIAPSIARELRKQRPDMLFESTFTTLTPRTHLNHLSVPRIPRVYIDSADYVKKGMIRRFINRIERPVINRAKAIITYSEMGRKRYIEDYSTDSEMIHVVPKPIDIRRFDPKVEASEIVQKFNLSGRTVVTYVGRLSRMKGIDSLLEVADSYQKDGGYKVFLFAGEGEIAKKPSARGNCIFTGHLEHAMVNKVMAASDIMVFPDFTRPPAFTTALAESMAMGKPIIAGLGGFEMAAPVEHMRNGIVVKPGSVSEMRTWIDRLSEDEGLRARLGHNARKFAEERMDWDKQVKIYKEIFEKAVSGA